MEIKTIKVYRKEGKIEKAFGQEYFCGQRTNNLWFKVLSEDRGELTLEWPDGGHIQIAGEKKENSKRPKVKKSFIKGQLRRNEAAKPAVNKPVPTVVAHSPVLPPNAYNPRLHKFSTK